MAERSRDWFRQAVHDLAHARNASGTGSHDWACFAAQQAAEKTLKALIARLGGESWGHSLLTTVTELDAADPEVGSLREAAIRLLLLEGLGRPTDVVVLTAAEWAAREGTGWHREVIARGIRLHPTA